VTGFSAPQINLYTYDVGRLLTFYSGLGFVETFRYAPAGQPVHVELTLDGFVLGIADAADLDASHGLTPSLNGRSIELVLWSDDTDGWFARLTAAGATALSPPHPWLEHLRLAWIADPDGNPIQLAQRVSPA
jgi:catechol 2,3-dioxygenase-like lactoylglutathione lyase family enzyme